MEPAFATYGIALVIGLALGFVVWPITRRDQRPYRRWLCRSVFVGLVIAPATIAAHGDFVVPAMWFVLFFVFAAFRGEIRLDVLVHPVVSIALTSGLVFLIATLSILFVSRAKRD